MEHLFWFGFGWFAALALTLFRKPRVIHVPIVLADPPAKVFESSMSLQVLMQFFGGTMTGCCACGDDADFYWRDGSSLRVKCSACGEREIMNLATPPSQAPPALASSPATFPGP